MGLATSPFIGAVARLTGCNSDSVRTVSRSLAMRLSVRRALAREITVIYAGRLAV